MDSESHRYCSVKSGQLIDDRPRCLGKDYKVLISYSPMALSLLNVVGLIPEVFFLGFSGNRVGN